MVKRGGVRADAPDISESLQSIMGDAVKSAAERAEEQVVTPVEAVEPKEDIAPEAEPEVAPETIPEPVAEPAPVVEKPKEAVQKPAKKPAPKPAAKPVVKKAKVMKRVPIPGRKPVRADSQSASVGAGSGVPDAGAPLAPSRPDAGISKERALSIALEKAPPAREFEVNERGDLYAVMFKDEGRALEVLVDRYTGEILSSKSLEAVGNSVPPGYLPRPVAVPVPLSR